MVNIHQAKTNFSKIINAAIAGDEIEIAKAGVLVAKIVPVTSGKPQRKPGALKGKIKLAKDFDAPLPDAVLTKFWGN